MQKKAETEVNEKSSDFIQGETQILSEKQHTINSEEQKEIKDDLLYFRTEIEKKIEEIENLIAEVKKRQCFFQEEIKKGNLELSQRITKLEEEKTPLEKGIKPLVVNGKELTDNHDQIKQNFKVYGEEASNYVKALLSENNEEKSSIDQLIIKLQKENEELRNEIFKIKETLKPYPELLSLKRTLTEELSEIKSRVCSLEKEIFPPKTEEKQKIGNVSSTTSGNEPGKQVKPEEVKDREGSFVVLFRIVFFILLFLYLQHILSM